MKQTIKNYALFLVGLFIASMGVALSTKAGLGTSPVAAVPYSVSIINHALTFGWWLNIWSLLQVSVQVLLLRKKCKPVEIIIQTVLALVYGYMTDFSCKLIDGIQANTYLSQFFWMALGCFVLAFGIWIQFKGGVAMLPGEAMNRAISEVSGKRYENIKILFDVLYIAAAAGIGFLTTGKLQGVREGSIIAAVVVGNIIKLYNLIFNKLTRKSAKNPSAQEAENAAALPCEPSVQSK